MREFVCLVARGNVGVRIAFAWDHCVRHSASVVELICLSVALMIVVRTCYLIAAGGEHR
jgi:hypothetical protein